MKDRDPFVLALLLAILYMLVKQQPTPAPEQARRVVLGDDGVCPFCDWRSTAEGGANIRRSITAHVRQIHPRDWRHIVSAGNRNPVRD